jgi:outer membrane protein OmpA-like peptidoglycan-associated protein
VRAPSLLAATVATCVALATHCAARAADTAIRIPLVVGLTTTHSVAEADRRDYETIVRRTEVGAKGYRILMSAELPDPGGSGASTFDMPRFVPIEDQRHARTLRISYWSRDPEVFPGTTPDASTEIVEDLRVRGAAALNLLAVEFRNNLPIERLLIGEVKRVGAGTEAFPILVNGRKVDLRVWHVAGRLSGKKGPEEVEFHILDDPANPLLLAVMAAHLRTQTTRIEFPPPPGAQDSIERKLADKEPADVYGIYFSFGSDVLRSESDLVLQEVADAMKRHPDWKLQVDGHTDNVGGSGTANLDLSRRRAAAVKAALVQRYAVAATRLESGGFGAARPKDTNDTVEGRALNRRVELRRL